MASSDFELVTLRNGHRAVRHTGNGEVMHPSVGPWAEANALYVEQAKLGALLERDGPPLCIFDVGLGAAANAVAAIAARTRGRALELHSFEIDLAPLKLALEDPAGFPFLVPHRALLETLIREGRASAPGLEWTLHLGDAERLIPAASGRPELIFHDPFSPESNPTLWTPPVFEALRKASADTCVLLTYSASTSTRASMLVGGWFVGVGAAIGTKQETTVAAAKRSLLQKPLDARWLQRWLRSTAKAPHGVELTAEVERRITGHPQFQNSAISTPPMS